MMSKPALLAVVLPLTFTSAFAAVQVIPEAQLDLKLMRSNQSKYVLKDAKGNFLEKMLNATTPENWFNLSPSQGVEGARTEETYERFGMPVSEDIIVAVVDSGVDVNHEDLQGNIWINQGEIADNGIDDDQNGYADDVFGWNFIGGKDGQAKIEKDETLKNGIRLVKGAPEAQTSADTLELTRELVRMKKLKAYVEDLGEELTAAQVAYLQKLSDEIAAARAEAKEVVATYTGHLENYKKLEATLRAAGLMSMTVEAVREFTSEDPAVAEAKAGMLQMLTSNMSEARLQRVLKSYGDQLKYYYNESFDPRSIVGDNYADHTEKSYGNNDVIGPDSSHGTHVAGSIAAVRDNGIGIKGVATKVKIMAVRVVPNGDERDKDVANGIRYAVDNGAKIINMSFGKAYSPTKKVVDDAMRYAESKGVLLVHAAGNDNKDNDLLPSYPSRFDKKEGREFKNWLEICATSFKKGPSLPAVFTNFGKKTVDFCAPGVNIYSATPNNTYGVKSGTSMAAPTVAGVAALTLSYSPEMDAEALKALLIDTSRRYPQLKVNVPGTENTVLFGKLSTYGSIVDAFEAASAIH
jgi:cell wall-associated protease